MTHHAAVWIDHSEARVFQADAFKSDDPVVSSVVVSPSAKKQLHRRAGSDDGHRTREDQPYYHAVVAALAAADDVLVLGPSTAKLELVKHAERHDPAFAAKIVGVETLDHPTDGQIAALVRQFFERADERHNAEEKRIHQKRRHIANLRAQERALAKASDPTGASMMDLRNDGLAEEFGEAFVRSATSGEDDREETLNAIVVEETGGPFVETESDEEIAHDEDPSNPPGATREPFPTS